MPKTVMQQAEIPQAKIMRLLQMVAIIHESHRATINELREQLDTSKRTIYRYIKILEAVGIPVDIDETGKIFIVDHHCPLCGKEVQHGKD